MTQSARRTTPRRLGRERCGEAHWRVEIARKQRVEPTSDRHSAGDAVSATVPVLRARARAFVADPGSLSLRESVCARACARLSMSLVWCTTTGRVYVGSVPIRTVASARPTAVCMHLHVARIHASAMSPGRAMACPCGQSTHTVSVHVTLVDE